MQWRSILVSAFRSANICAVWASLLLMPAPAAAQSLLEAWVFAHHRALIPIEQLKESGDGTIVAPEDPDIAKEGTEVWSIIDKPNCIIRVEHSSSGSVTEFYLNNMSATRPTLLRSDGSFQIGLMGDKPVHCRHTQSEKLCEHFTTLPSSDANGYRAIEKALNHIYAKYCRYETPPPNIPRSHSDLPSSHRVMTGITR